MPTALLGGEAAAADIAFINSFGNLSGFAAPFMIGVIKDATKSTDAGLHMLAGLFSHLECGASLFGKLPKIRKVLAATGIAREHTMMIGDEIRDARVSADAGIDFGAVAWGFNDVESLLAENPRQLFRQVGDLLDGAGPVAQNRVS